MPTCAVGRSALLTDSEPTPVDWAKDVLYNAASRHASMVCAPDRDKLHGPGQAPPLANITPAPPRTV